MVWEITFTKLGELPRVLPFLLHTCVNCVMGATPMADAYPGKGFSLGG